MKILRTLRIIIFHIFEIEFAMPQAMFKFVICNNFWCLNWNCLKIGIFAQGSYSLNSTSDSLLLRDTVRKMKKICFWKEIENAYSGLKLNISFLHQMEKKFEAHWNKIEVEVFKMCQNVKQLKLWILKISQISILTILQGLFRFETLYCSSFYQSFGGFYTVDTYG